MSQTVWNTCCNKNIIKKSVNAKQVYLLLRGLLFQFTQCLFRNKRKQYKDIFLFVDPTFPFLFLSCVDSVMVVGFSPTTYGMRNDPAAISPVIMRKLEVEGKKKPKETVIGIKETISFQRKEKTYISLTVGFFAVSLSHILGRCLSHIYFK